MEHRPAPILAFRDLTLGYGREPALSGLDGEVLQGDTLAVIGPNGAGKSTLLKGIVGEASVLAGRIERPGAGPRDIAYLPQRSEVDRSFPITVADFAAIGLWTRIGPFRPMRRADRERVAEALGRVGLAGKERRLIGELSGGQMQRLLFARTWLQDAPVILLDEPFTAIDTGTTEDLLAIVAGWHRDGRTVLAALHELRQVRALFPKTLLLAGRPIAWGPTERVLTPENLDRGRQFDGWALDTGTPHPPGRAGRPSASGRAP